MVFCRKSAIVALAFVFMICTLAGSVMVGIAATRVTRAYTGGVTRFCHSSSRSLFRLDGRLNGQIAANILRDAGHPQFSVSDGVSHIDAVHTDGVYRWTYFRLFPDQGAGTTLSLSRIYWRIAAVLGEDGNQRIAMWAVNGYRNSVFRSASDRPNDGYERNLYSRSTVRINIFTDFGLVGDGGFPAEIHNHDAILPKGGDGTVVPVGDRIWLPSQPEIVNGGIWNVRGASRSYNPRGFNNGAWLASYSSATSLYSIATNGVFVTHRLPTATNGAVRPALYLCVESLVQSASSYRPMNRTLFTLDGNLNEDVRVELRSKIRMRNFTTPFRLWPDVSGTTSTFALSRTYFRVSHLETSRRSNGSRGVVLWAEEGYRNSAFDTVGHSFIHDQNNPAEADNVYSNSLVRHNLLTDFGQIGVGGGFPEALRDSGAILPKGDNNGNIIPETDLIWLPLQTEVMNGGTWNFTDSELRRFNARGTNARSWLSSPSGASGVYAYTVVANPNLMSVTDSYAIRPALYLCYYYLLTLQDLLEFIEELRAQAELDRAAIAVLQQMLSDFIEEMEDLLDDHDDRITDLENRMTAVENELEELGEQLEDLQDAIEALDDIEDRLDQMRADITMFNRLQLVGMIGDLEEMLDELRDELGGLDFIDESELENILNKIAALELALEGIDVSLEDEHIRVEIEAVIYEIMNTVLPGTLTALSTRIGAVEGDIQALLNDLEEIIADIVAILVAPTPAPRDRSGDMLMYLGIGAFVLGIAAMSVGSGIIVASTRKKGRQATGE